MDMTMALIKEKAKERLAQAEEMEDIWNKSDEMTRMFLRGCIFTANALASSENYKRDEK